jgi:16S rRNA (cytosine967-C5)-methyltransferase
LDEQAMVAISRRIALSVLDGLDDTEAFPDRLLDSAFETEANLIQKDRALATGLVYGVLRWRGRLDWVIGKLSSTPINKMAPSVLNALRLGVYQILFLSRIPPSAAVNDSVELVKSRAPAWVVGFTNGVLRAATRRGKQIPLPPYGKNPVHAMAVRESHPLWLVQRWSHRFGIEETKRLCQANNQIPPLTVQANTLKVSRDELLAVLRDSVKEAALTKHAPDGISLRGLRQALPEIPSFKEGWFHVQDEASQLITRIVSPEPGERVLDACAGFGGKTAGLAQLMKGRGEITAMDNQPWKLRQLVASMARLGITSVRTFEHDLSRPLPPEMREAFDRVLLDSPCSGLGVLRRNPDAKWKKKETDLAGLQVNQIGFLHCLAQAVRKGGCMVYAVCSQEPEEGELVVKGFLEQEEGFVVDQEPAEQLGSHEGLFDSRGFFRSFPHRHDMDGFFAVRFKRVAP